MNWEFFLTAINTGKAGKGENRGVKGLESHGRAFPSRRRCVRADERRSKSAKPEINLPQA